MFSVSAAPLCPVPGCLAPNKPSGKKHGWNYHVTPVSFEVGGMTLCFRSEEGRLFCPFPQCSASVNRRDRGTKHAREVHGLSESVVIFEGPAAAEVRGGPASPANVTVLDGSKEIKNPGDATSSRLPEHAEGNFHGNRVVLDPKVNYLEGGAVLDDLGIWFHRGLAVFICRACGVCLTSEMAKGHCKIQHKAKVSPNASQELQAFTEHRDVYKLPEEVALPRPGGPAVQGLSFPEKGFACRFEGCGYSVKSEDVMKKHERTVHKRGPLQPFTYEVCKVQALFQAIGKVYFEVEERLKEGEEQRLHQALKQVGASSVTAGEAAIATDKDRTPPALLRVTGWSAHLPEVRACRTLRERALALKGRRENGELGGILPGLDNAVDELFRIGRTALDGRASKLTVLKLLMHGEDIPSEGAKHWKTIPDSNGEYQAFTKEMLTAILRSASCTLSSEGFHFVLSREQKLSLQALEDALRRRSSSGATTSCQNFLWRIVSAQGGDRWKDVVQQWIWLRALRRDGNFYGPSSLTPDLAKLKYLMRQTTLLQAFVEEFKSEEELIERVMKLHASALKLGKSTPFNMVTELSEYASSLVFSEVKDPKVTVSSDYQSFTVGTQTMSLDRLREGLKQAITGIWMAYDHIVQCNRVVPEGFHVVDDLSNDTRGYSFLDEKPFSEKRRGMFYHLVDVYQLASLDFEGKLCWDIPQVKSLLGKCERLWDNVLHILFMTGGVSTRVSQFLRTQLRNGDRQRGIQFRSGEMFIVARDTKMSNAAGKDSCIPSFPPSQVAQLLLELIGGGLREAEALLVGLVYGTEALEMHKSYLCMREGKRLEPDQFYSRFVAKNGELFDCSWGSRDYRQGAIAMARHFISPDATFAALDDALAEAADHSVDIDHTHYGRTFTDHPRLTHNDIERQRWICLEWHSFLGLGPFPVQEPLTVVRSRGGPIVDKDALKSALSEMVPELCSAIADAVVQKLQASLPRSPVVSGAAPTATLSRANTRICPPSSTQTVDAEAKAATVPHTSHLAAAGIPSSSSRSRPDPPLAPLPSASVEAEASSEFHSSTIQGSHPAAASMPSLPRLCKDSPNASAGRPVQKSPPAKRHRFLMELDVFSSSPPLAGPSGSHSIAANTRPINSNPKDADRLPAEASQVDFDAQFTLLSSPSPCQPTLLRQKPTVVPESWASQPIVPLGQRKRRAPEPIDSDLDGQHGLEAPAKRVCSGMGRASRSLFSEDEAEDASEDDSDDDRGSLADFIVPSTPDSTTTGLLESIRSTIARIVGDPNAREKSAEQMDALLAIMEEDPRDLAAVLRTGGGKSLLWTVPPLLDAPGVSVVICPFRSLLEQQYERCTRAGVRCHNYSVSKDVGENVQNLFLQVEHVGMEVFQSLLMQPVGKKIKRVFIDEFHDMLQCHPDRRSRWQTLARQCAQMDIQMILLSATCPPSMTDSLLKPFRLNEDRMNFIRGPTDRPEIGLHYIRALYTADNNPLHSIVNRLHDMLQPEERILVFFNSKKELLKFTSAAKCAAYHSELWEPGNTKDENVQRWDSGETKVMACTTGFAQGMDRPHVRFVVMKDPQFGLLLAMQMMGRAGRDGKESHAFIVDDEPGQIFKTKSLTSSTSVKQVLGDDKKCRVQSTTAVLDGKDHRYRCKDRPGRVACDVCNPSHPIHLAAVAASREVNGPIRPVAGFPKVPAPQLPRRQRAEASIAPKAKAQVVPLSHMLVCKESDAVNSEPQPTLSQDSDDLYGPPVLDSMSLWVLAEAEGHHPSPLERAGVCHSGLTRRRSVAELPLFATKESKVPGTLLPASQPVGTSAQRAAEAQRIKRQRLERTRKLNKYAPVLKDMCIAHLLESGLLVPEHFPAPCSEMATAGPVYNEFRRSFKFKPYAYCYNCGLPQDQNRNGEAPECHKAYVPGGVKKCPFQFVVFKCAFIAGQMDNLLPEMRRALDIPGQSFEEYLAWASSEREVEGRYHNSVEVLLWCCERLERQNPRLFL